MAHPRSLCDALMIGLEIHSKACTRKEGKQAMEITCLLCRREDMSSAPSTHVDLGITACNCQVSAGAHEQVAGSHWPASLT